MIDQILDLQRLEAGLMALVTSRFDLVALTRRVAEEVGSLTTQHRLTVEGEGSMTVVADRRRVEEVLQNLLQNAIKYSPGGGEIVVRVTRDERDGGRAVVAVSDQGIGISPEAQPRVFETHGYFARAASSPFCRSTSGAPPQSPLIASVKAWPYPVEPVKSIMITA